jgi:hypothetical protein
MRRKIPALPLVAAFVLCLAVVAQPALAQQRGRPERIGGKPNLNGIWQAANEAHWNLEGHSAQSLPDFASKMGAIAAIPAGQSFVVGGTIPYLPAALAKRDENRAGWPASDPEAKCYMPGIPRATYMPYPFQIVQGEGDQILFSYTFANANRPVFMRDHQRAPVDLWMGRSNGAWDGDTLVIEVNSNIENTWLDRAGNHHSAAMIVTERYTLVDEHMMQYEATIEDPETFSRPWTIRMPLYRRAEADARLLELNCVKFSEPLLYGEFTSRDEAQAAPSR